MKERLQSHFWDKLCFFSPKSQTNWVQWRNTLQRLIFDCAEIIRNEILNFKNPFPSWPPTQNELLTCNESIPPYLEKLLLGIISSNTEKTEQKLRTVSSIGQDIIYNANWGEKKTLKHVSAGCFNKAEN